MMVLLLSACSVSNVRCFDMSQKDYSSRALNKTDNSGNKTGVWMESVEHGYCYTSYKNGKKNGLMMCYSLDSVLQKSMQFKNDMRHGKYTEYLPSGSIVQIARYKKDSISKSYSVDEW